MTKAESYINIRSEKLQEWCSRVIKRIQQNRHKQAIEYASERAEKHNSGWWHRLWKDPDITPETMLERIKADTDFFNPYWHITTYACTIEEVAERLAASCVYAPIVTVSSEDIKWLDSWTTDKMANELFGHRIR
jgi:hypothetical protein